MKKALITLLTSLILITTIFFMVGCSDMMAKLGNISLTIDLDTPEVDVAAYTMEGSLLDSSSRFTLNNIVPPRHTLSELKEGRWNLTVKAFDDQDNQIGIGTKTVDLKAGQVVETSLLVEFGQSTPVLSTFTIAGPSRYDDREGSVAGTTTRMEYRLASAAADDPFTACTADTTQLVPGTYHIRLAQAHGLQASECLTVTVPAYAPIQLTIIAPTLMTTKEYDGTNTVQGSITAGTLSGVLSGDEVTVHAQASYDSSSVGNKTITVTYFLGGADANNYLKPVNATPAGVIQPKQLSITGTSVTTSKVYDNSTNAAVLNHGSLVGVIGSEAVSVTAHPVYQDRHAGTGKLISVSYTLGGTHAGNYLAPANTSFSGTITKSSLTVTYTTTPQPTKVYDGTATAQIATTGSLVGVVIGDTVELLTTATYDDHDAGSSKSGTISYALSGTDANNYTAPANGTFSSGTITARPLAVTGYNLTASKPYDGNTNASIGSVAFNGKIAADDIQVSATAAYDSATVSSEDLDKTITITYSISGDDALNYLEPVSSTADGTIVQKQLTVSGTDIASTKVYDGSTLATVESHGTLGGKVDGEVVTVTAHPVYQDRHAGTGKLINVSYTLGGTHAGNYRAPANANFVGEITPKALEVSGTSVQLSKVYDGSTTAVVTASGSPSNLVSGDAVTVHAQASYDSADANEGKTLTVTYSISGANAKNYTAPAPSTYGSTGTITKRQLTVTVGNHTKIYGQENPSFTVNISGFVNGESASTAGGYVAPTASTAATTTTDTGTYEISISGGSATNYSFNTSDTGTLTINKATYDMSAISFTDKTVTYNGTEQSLPISGTLPSGVTVSYTNNAKTDAGTYTATAHFSGDATNYEAIADKTATFIISKAVLTATVGDHARTYGAANPEFPVSVLGFVNGETASTANSYVAPTASTTTTTTNATDAGTYEISISGGSATNYSFNTSDTGTLTINKATYDMSAISFTDKTVTYNGTEQSLPISGTLPSGVTVSYTNNAKTDAGTYTATAHFSGDATNYEAIADKTATFIISKAVLTATVGDHARTYGAANPEFPVSVLGFVNGETASTANSYVAPTASTSATTSTAVGTATITISGGSATNYSFNTSDTGMLTINKATYDMSAISFTDKTVTYNGTEQSLPISGTLPSGVTVSYTNNAKTDAGTYTATAHFSGDATNYEAIADKTATFIISKAVLTATVGDHARTYGAANPEFPVSVLGFVNGETASTANSYVAPTASTSATTSTAVGTATITISGGSATNYSFNTSDTGMLTINKATYDMSAISFTDKTVTYNGTEQSLPISGTLPSGVTVSYTNNAKTDAGTYTATAHFSGDATNYEAIADKTATFIISKAVLTATVGDHARTYGAANPEFPVSVLGFVNGETASTANSYVAPTASTSATTSTAVGTATITISGGSATNYSFNTSDTGMLTINKATYDMSAISFTDKTVTYNGTEQSLPISGTLPSGVTVSYTNNAKTDAGTYTATAHFSGDATNYEAIADKTATFIISKAVLTATVGDHARTYGAANPEFPVSVLGFVNGETASTANSYVAPTASTSATTSTAVGTATITISGGSATNYSFNTSDTGMLTINKATYDMSAISFTDKTVTYNGTEQSLPISGTLPSGVTVSYTNNAKTDAGTYTATAHFSGDATNYEAIADKTALLIIEPITMTGSVTLTGSCTYGETLTAVPTLTNAGPAPTYIWLRNGGLIAGATSPTYTLTEADIGRSIKVAINATAGNYKGQVVSTAANISKAVGSALSGTFEAYYPIISASQTNITQDIINLIGFTANQTGIEASISTNGTTYESYSSLEIDSRGRAMISVTSAQKIKLRYEATTTHYAGADLLLTVGEKDLAIGDYYAGGVVGYIYQSTDTGYMTNQVHGLIAAKADTSTNGSKWSSNNTLRIGTGVGIGTGSTNTDAIILALDGSEIGMYGAKEARLYTNGGYNDWFLPSWHELLQLRNNKLLIGNFDTSNWSTYMSSSESTQYGWHPEPFYHAVYFDTNLNNYVWDKPAATHIRAVRYF